MTILFVLLTTATIATATTYTAPWSNSAHSDTGYKACSGSNTFTDFNPSTATGIFTGYDKAVSTASGSCNPNTAEKNIIGSLQPLGSFTAGSSTCTSCTIAYNFTFMDYQYVGCSGGGGNATSTVWSYESWFDDSTNVQGPTVMGTIWSFGISCPSGSNTLGDYTCKYWDQSVGVTFTSGNVYSVTVGIYARAYTNPAYNYQATSETDLENSNPNCRFGTTNFAELNSISIT